MKKKLLLIIVPVLFMIGATVYMAIHLSQNSFQTFSRAGYILSNEMQSKNTTQSSGIKFYFNENTDYKDSYDNMVEFKDTNGEKVKVSDASFVHYTDQSISLLKKGVIFNLDEINQKVPKYYNLFEGTVLEYNQDQYSVDNLGKKLTFKYFIVRVSENKYLVVSPYLRLQLDSSTERVLNHSYVEITFMDDRVVRIENQEVSYQTIAKNAAIYFSEHLYLNLDNEYFYYDDDAKINLGQIVIDSSDNIDIAPLDEDYLEKEKDEGTSTNSESNSNGGNGNQTDTGNGFGNGLDGGNSFGNVGGSLNGEYGGLENDSSSDSSVEDEHYAIPTATVTDLTVTSNRLQADIRIVDDDSLIRGGALTTIINNHTGKVVYSMESEEGTYHIPVSVENLTPDTTYSLNTRITYEKNDTLYTMDVVSQLFVTESIGIHLEKDYYTSSELAFLVKIDDYSKVQSADVTLYSSTGEMVGTFSVSSLYAQTLEGQQVVFRELNPDTKYSVTITQIIYDDYAISDDYFVEMSAKTLKTKPVVGDVKFTIDKRKSLFTLQLNHTSDPNNGIENYRYEVYDARTLADGASPIAVFEKDKNVSIDLAVDEVTIHRAVPYVFRVVALFYDNEKYIEYSTGYSETMQMDGVEPPSFA